MPGLLLDTHAAIWYLEESPRLSATAPSAIQAALAAGCAGAAPPGDGRRAATLLTPDRPPSRCLFGHPARENRP